MTISDATAWILPVRAVPNASRNEIVGWEAGALKLKVRAVPEDGKANKTLIRFLSKAGGCPRSALELVGGATSRHKRIAVTGVAASEFFKALGVAPMPTECGTERS